MASAIQDLKRAREILEVVAKNGFLVDPALGARVPGLGILNLKPDLEVAGRSRGDRARRALEALGPTFVKLGQVLSTRPDILPGDLIESLGQLQKSVAPLPPEDLEALIEGYLGSPIEDHFEELDLRPLAAASIAQVHRGRLKVDGRVVDVVMKVQRPGIREKMESDLSILHALARLFEGSIVEGTLYQPMAIVSEFEAVLLQELDFLNEARNLAEVAKNFAGRPGLLELPQVYSEVTTTKLLVMSFVPGIRITEIVGRAEYDGGALLKKALSVIFEMVFEDGFFHGDPHPGNVLVTPDGRIGMLDFGLMGRLTREQRKILVELLLCVIGKNAAQLTRVVMKMGKVPPAFDRLAFEAGVSRIMERYLGVELANISSRNLIRECMDLMIAHGVRLPTEYAVLGRAAATLEGIGRIIYPEFNVLELGTPFVSRLVANRFDPAELGPSAVSLMSNFQELITSGPIQATRALEDLEAGRIQLGIKGPVLDEVLAMQRIHSLRMVVIASASALLLTGAITIAPFQYTLSGLGLGPWPIPVVPLLCFLLMLMLLWFLLLTYVFPKGPRKVSLRTLRFFRGWPRRSGAMESSGRRDRAE
ncbi:MAG: AarF/ABC1/UbiB kinase family protein [Deltaproteobacteria bacterium]|nr:AarF/ABC1/UbiB kinase family protein [Deltaproteobacteria bacterium]